MKKLTYVICIVFEIAGIVTVIFAVGLKLWYLLFLAGIFFSLFGVAWKDYRELRD